MARPLRFKEGVVQFMVRVPTEIRDQLQELSAEDGRPIAEHVRRALINWINGARTTEKPKRRSVPRVNRKGRVSLLPADATDD